MGRLTREPEVRYSSTDNAMTVARFSIAVPRKAKSENGDDCDFINCIAFGKSGDFVEKYLHKGTKIALCGRIQTGSYTNRDGKKVYTTDVIAEEFYFAESKSSTAGNNDGGYTATSRTSSPLPAASNDGFMNIPDGIDEDLPFA